MAPTLNKWPKYSVAASQRIEGYFVKLPSVHDFSLQTLIGELLVIKVAQILEQSLPRIFTNLICGAQYLDGSAPKILKSASSHDAAIKLMKKYQRKNPLQLKWLSSNDIKKNIEFLIDKSDHCYSLIDQFVGQLDEIRVVRNEIAHSIPETRKKFKDLVMARYGSSELSSSVGKYVLTKKTTLAPIEEYAIVSRALIKQLCIAT